MLKCYDLKHYLELKHSSIQKRLIHVDQNKYVSPVEHKRRNLNKMSFNTKSISD